MENSSKSEKVECETCLGAAYYSLARQVAGLPPLCVGLKGTVTKEVSTDLPQDKSNRITVDDDFHCLGYSVTTTPGQFPICIKGIQSFTEKAIISPEGRRMDIDYDRVSTIVGSGKAKHLGQVSAVEVISFKWRDLDEY